MIYKGGIDECAVNEGSIDECSAYEGGVDSMEMTLTEMRGGIVKEGGIISRRSGDGGTHSRRSPIQASIAVSPVN